MRAKGPVSVTTVCITELGRDSLYISSLPGQVEPGTTWNGDGTADPQSFDESDSIKLVR